MSAPPMKRRRPAVYAADHCEINEETTRQLTILHARGRGGPFITSADGVATLPPLNTNTLRHVLSFLTLYDLARLSCISRRFYHTVWEEDSFGAGHLELTDRTAHIPQSATDSMLTMILQYAHKIRSLAFSVDAPSSLIDAVAHILPKVTTLTLPECRHLSAVHAQHVVALFDNLTTLDIDCHTWSVGFILPAKMPHLRWLRIRMGTSLSDLLRIQWLGQLSMLRLELRKFGLPKEFETLATRCQNLQALYLTFRPGPAFQWFSYLNPQMLIHLHITAKCDQDNVDVSDWLQSLSCLTALQTLRLWLRPVHAYVEKRRRIWSQNALVAMMRLMPELRCLFIDLSADVVRFDDTFTTDSMLRRTVDKCVHLAFFCVPIPHFASPDVAEAWRRAHPRIDDVSMRALITGAVVAC